MRTKNESITLEKLNPIFTKPLQEFDLMHKSMTGEQVVITSANDGKHMKGSKHYTNDAVDIRSWHYDHMNSDARSDFWFKTFEIFPGSKFDFLHEKDHFHLEYDPKPKLDIPKPRIKQPPDYVVPEVPEDVELTDRQIVVSTLDRLWHELDGRSVIFGSVNFITKRITGFGFFKDRKDDQSIFGRLLELINIIIQKMRGEGK